MPLTPADISTSESISGLKLSKDASRVVYTVSPISKPGKHITSALWIAETSKAGSAVQITSGTYHDHSAQFNPDTSKPAEIFFLSDRHAPGDADQIYRFILAPFAREPIPLTPISNKKGISSFYVSPNGYFIAFTSPDEPVEGTTAVDPIVFGDKTKFGRLRVIDLRTHALHTLISVDFHVHSNVTWSPDSSQILYRLKRSSDLESDFFPVQEFVITLPLTFDEVNLAIATDSIRHITTHPRLPGRSVWTKSGDLFYIQSVTPDNGTSANAVWKSHSKSGTSVSPSRIAFGINNTAEAVVDLGYGSQIAVAVADGLHTRISIIDSASESLDDATSSQFTVLNTAEDSSAFNELDWDIQHTHGERYIYAILRSSSVSNEAGNVWCGGLDAGGSRLELVKLSSHNVWFTEKECITSKEFRWTGSDGETLQGIMTYPTTRRELPAVIVPHGGPYGRDTFDLVLSFSRWRIYLATHGYIVLSPNYRGSSGRGDIFSTAANGGMGTLDWDDVHTMIIEAIKQNIVDPNRLAIAGWSQGGFLTAWGCTRPPVKEQHYQFKAGIVGAGPTDWGSMAITSDMPDFEAALGGNAPWAPDTPQYLTGSPIRYIKNLKTPLLILHGQADERVPVTQAIGFMRGIVRETEQGGKESQLVIYPREGHLFKEREHIEDALKRVIEFLDARLK